MRVVIIFTFTLLSIFLNAQEQTESKFEIIPRAKVLGTGIFEDVWVHSVSAGAEIRYNKRFSFVADLVHFRWKFEEEVYKTPGVYTNYDEFASYDARNYIALELRYYPQLNFLKPSIKPYINVFSKLGAGFIHLQSGYPMSEELITRQNSSIKDLGASLGMCYGENFGFDFNIGAMHRWEKMNQDIFHESGTEFKKNVIGDRYGPNIRVSFFYHF